VVPTVDLISQLYSLVNNLATPVVLSPQHVCDCATKSCCKGGWPEYALQFAQLGGIAPLSVYPYSATDSTKCQKVSSSQLLGGITGWEKVPPNLIQYQKAAAQTPFLALIYASSSFQVLTLLLHSPSSAARCASEPLVREVLRHIWWQENFIPPTLYSSLPQVEASSLPPFPSLCPSLPPCQATSFSSLKEEGVPPSPCIPLPLFPSPLCINHSVFNSCLYPGPVPWLMQQYKGGIYTGPDCTKSYYTPNHAVLVVGYNLTASTPYFLIKNSWGTAWGEQGYMRLAMNTNVCGFAT
jgi:hypothetical protein